jgi:hypothetical protein
MFIDMQEFGWICEISINYGKWRDSQQQVLFSLEKPRPLGGVRVHRLCLKRMNAEYRIYKSQIPSTKLQINLKFQYPMT